MPAGVSSPWIPPRPTAEILHVDRALVPRTVTKESCQIVAFNRNFNEIWNRGDNIAVQ